MVRLSKIFLGAACVALGFAEKEAKEEVQKEEVDPQKAAEIAAKDAVLRKKIDSVLPQFDLNKDGNVTKEEYIKVTRTPFFEDRARAWWKKADLDKDDFVTLQEYYVLYGIDVEEGSEPIQEVKKYRNWETAKFNLADLDKDEALNWEEFLALVETRGDALLDFVAKADFIGGDADKDRLLTAKEFKERTSSNKAMFKMLDKDGNKALTFDEFRRKNTHIFQYDVMTLLTFITCDKDKDTTLNHNEMFECAKAGRKKKSGDTYKLFRQTIDRHSEV